MTAWTLSRSGERDTISASCRGQVRRKEIDAEIENPPRTFRNSRSQPRNRVRGRSYHSGAVKAKYGIMDGTIFLAGSSAPRVAATKAEVHPCKDSLSVPPDDEQWKARAGALE